MSYWKLVCYLNLFSFRQIRALAVMSFDVKLQSDFTQVRMNFSQFSSNFEVGLVLNYFSVFGNACKDQ